MSERRISWIPIVACWGGFALILATETWLSMITHGHSPLRLLGYQVAVWSFWALITPAIVRFTERFPPYPFSPRHWLYHCGARYRPRDETTGVDTSGSDRSRAGEDDQLF